MEGDWFGIHLGQPTGRNDGSVAVQLRREKCVCVRVCENAHERVCVCVRERELRERGTRERA